MNASRAGAVLAVAAVLLLAGCGQGPDAGGSRGDEATGAPVPFEVLDETSNSGRDAGAEHLVVALTGDDFVALWTEHVSPRVPAPPAPSVDFAVSTVVGVFDDSVGPLALTGVTEEGDEIIVHIDKTDTSACPRVQVVEHNAVVARIEVPADPGTTFTVARTVTAADCP